MVQKVYVRLVVLTVVFLNIQILRKGIYSKYIKKKETSQRHIGDGHILVCSSLGSHSVS